MKKLLNIVAWITLLMALGIMTVLIYWMVYPYKVADFKNLPFPVLNENKVVQRGERIRYLLDYCKYTDEIPELRKFLVNSVVYEITDTVGVATKGCRQTEADVYISRNIPTGEYFIRTYARYKVNPIRTIEIINYTEKFEVK